MRILVVGAGGQVGGKLAARARDAGHSVYGTYRLRPPALEGVELGVLDKTKVEEVETTVRRVAPDAIVDTGALHNVDYCESHPEEAMAVNRDGTRRLARAARERRARFVFVSTDFVFDGSGHPPYRETDLPHPQSVYARSKLEGEVAAHEADLTSAAARPSVIYSWTPLGSGTASSSGKPLNFASWLVRQVLDGKRVRIVDDQVASPTLADDLAGALLVLAGHRATGVFHAAGATALSRYDFADRLLRRVGLGVALLDRISSDQLQQVAVRPKNSALVSDRLAREVGYRTLEIGPALDRFAAQLAADPALPGRSR
jgi:dTDP-4-dehydrorhamnose reductase